MAPIGIFDPEMLKLAWFDDLEIRSEWFEDDNVDTPKPILPVVRPGMRAGVRPGMRGR